jgi:hypothetical protein
MSYISKIQKIEVNYLAQVVAKTRRDDAELLAQYGEYRCSDADSASLLWALTAHWPRDQFDELDIAVDAPYSRPLLAALSFMKPTVRRIPGSAWRQLTAETKRDVWRWMLGVEGRDSGGMKLDRNRGGWCQIAIVGRRQ